MKKAITALLLIGLIQPFFVEDADAAHSKKHDRKISINTGLNIHIPVNSGELSYELQEAIHENVTDTTGIEIDHYYLWIELDGQSIIGIDPIRGMF